jgi:hypothetical protein
MWKFWQRERIQKFEQDHYFLFGALPYRYENLRGLDFMYQLQMDSVYREACLLLEPNKKKGQISSLILRSQITKDLLGLMIVYNYPVLNFITSFTREQKRFVLSGLVPILGTAFEYYDRGYSDDELLRGPYDFQPTNIYKVDTSGNLINN